MKNTYFRKLPYIFTIELLLKYSADNIVKQK